MLRSMATTASSFGVLLLMFTDESSKMDQGGQLEEAALPRGEGDCTDLDDL